MSFTIINDWMVQASAFTLSNGQWPLLFFCPPFPFLSLASLLPPSILLIVTSSYFIDAASFLLLVPTPLLSDCMAQVTAGPLYSSSHLVYYSTLGF